MEADTATLVLVLTPYSTTGTAGSPKTLSFTIEPSDSYSTSEYSESSGSVFSTDAQTESVYIYSVNPSQETVQYGSSVTVNAVTTNGAASVWIKDPYGNSVAETSYYTTDSSERRCWSLSISPSSTGSYYLYAKDSRGNEVNSYFSLTVENGTSSSSGELYINSITASASTVGYGEEVILTVSTTVAAEQLRVIDTYGSTLYETTSYSTSGSSRIWEVNIYPTASGYYYVYAVDYNGTEVSGNTSIYVN